MIAVPVLIGIGAAGGYWYASSSSYDYAAIDDIGFEEETSLRTAARADVYEEIEPIVAPTSWEVATPIARATPVQMEVRTLPTPVAIATSTPAPKWTPAPVLAAKATPTPNAVVARSMVDKRLEDALLGVEPKKPMSSPVKVEKAPVVAAKNAATASEDVAFFGDEPAAALKKPVAPAIAQPAPLAVKKPEVIAPKVEPVLAKKAEKPAAPVATATPRMFADDVSYEAKSKTSTKVASAAPVAAPSQNEEDMAVAALFGDSTPPTGAGVGARRSIKTMSGTRSLLLDKKIVVQTKDDKTTMGTFVKLEGGSIGVRVSDGTVKMIPESQIVDASEL